MNEHAAGMLPGGSAPPQGSSGNPAIEIENLAVSYRKNQVLKALNLEVPAGSICGFLGVNGAGKTTTIKTLLGFRAPTGGRARVLGYDSVTQHREIAMYVGYVSETSSLYDFLTVPQLCALSRDLQRRWNQSTVEHYLALFGLPRNRRVRAFSKGMKAQLALCLALGNDPELLILDEPMEGLDPVARELFLNTLIRDVAASGKTIFFSSHILAEVEAIADRVAVLYQGTIVLNAELDALRESQQVLRLVYTEQPPADEVALLRRLPGVCQLQQEGRSVRLRVEGDAEALAQSVQARPYVLRDFEIVPVRLEEVLLEYLKGEGT